MLNHGALPLAVCAFAAYVVAVLLGLRLLRRTEPALVVVAASFAVFAAAAVLLAVAAPPFNAWVFVAIYWFLVMAFVVAFGAVYKSLSLRILSELMDRAARTDSYAVIFDRYLVKDSYANRLAVIREKRFADVADGRYALSQRGRKLATRVRAVQRAFGITRSG